MIAKSLLVNGPSRFLSTIYTNDLTVGGGLNITGTINLAAGTNSSASLQINSKGALYGYDAWLRINEQKQFTSGVYFGTNIVRTDGSFQIGNAGANINLTTSAATFKVPINVNGTTYYWNTSGSINANAGTFVTLNSPKGVFTNIIVTDTLVATHQEIEHVANLGGVFLVTPTVKCISSGSGKTLTSLTVTAANITRTDSNGESITYNYTLAINDSAFSTATIGGNTWGQYGEVKVSGNINGVVLGTCKGFIQSINTTSHVLTVAIKYTGVQTPATPSDISTVVDLNVMLTTIYDSGNSRHNPVGIWMRSRDTNGYSHISLYGGTSEWPTVRIGNLTNLPDINGVTPDGWGIYTDHGFFSGVIVSTSGKIGNFTISSALYSSTHSDWNTNVDGIYIGSDYISFGKQGVTYFKPDGTGKIGAWTVSATAFSNGTYGSDSSVFISTANMASKAIAGRTGADWRVTVGSHFGVTNTGALYANSANITGAINASSGTIGSNSTNKINIGTDTTNASIYYGVESLSDTSHDGFYIGADGIVLGKGIFKVTDGGALTATSATITGAINADTGTIGGSNGWTIASQQISSGTIGNNQSMFLGTKNLGSSTTIGGREGSDWRFTVGSNFGVTNTGAIYASSATINSGTIASSVTIGDTTASTVVSNAANGASAYSRKTAFNSTCSTSASTRIKAVTCAGFTLTAGNTITIRFTTANTYKAGSVKLNINNLGAKDIYVSGAATSTTNLFLWSINANITFIYDGQGFRVVSEPRIWYGTCSTAANTAVKQATVYESVVCKGTKVALNMTNNNTSDSASLYITGQADNARSIYYGTTSNVPTTANEYGWKSSSTATFVFDGSVWRYDDASTMNQGYTAAKTATNFIVADSTGLMVADMSGGKATSSTVTARNVFIDSNSVDIRNGQKVLASYGESTLIGDPSDYHVSIGSTNYKEVDLSTLSWSTRYTGTVNKTLSTSLPEAYEGYNQKIKIICENYSLAGYVGGVGSLSTPDTHDVGFYGYRNSSNPRSATIYLVIPVNDTPSGEMIYSTANSDATPSIKLYSEDHNVLARFGERVMLGKDGENQLSLDGSGLFAKTPNGEAIFIVQPGVPASTSVSVTEDTGYIRYESNNSFTYTLTDTPSDGKVDVYGHIYFDENETTMSSTDVFNFTSDGTTTWQGTAGSSINYDGSIEKSGNTFTISITCNSQADHAVFYFAYKTTTSSRSAAYITFGSRISEYQIGDFSTVFGRYCYAEGRDSFASGYLTRASGAFSHCEGQGSWSYGPRSHAEGNSTTARGSDSHAEGNSTIAGGIYSHAEGFLSEASASYSHAQNCFTKASSDSQTAIGKYNIEDINDTYAFIIGNGTDDDARSNAIAVKWDGTLVGPMVSYKVNDTFSITQYNLHGIISTASKDIILSLETEKDMSEITTVSVTALTGALRGVKGVIDSTSHSTNWLTGNVYTVTATKKSRRHVEIRIVRKNGAAFSNTTNETPVSLYATITLQFT